MTRGKPGRGKAALGKIAKYDHFRLLSQKKFGLYTLGNSFSLTGTWMQRIGLIWLVWDWTGSGFWLGVLATADMLPTLLLGPIGGAVADRRERLKLTRFCQTGLASTAALFGILLIMDLLTLPLLLALAVANGALIAMNHPARLALVQSLVVRADVPTAVAVSAVNINLARIIGPAIAGVMILHFDVHWVFIVNALVTFLFVAILGQIRIDPQPARKPGGSVARQIWTGAVFAFQNRGIRILLIMLFFGGAAARSVQDLFPVFAVRNFELAATGLAVLTSCMAAGAIVSGLTFRTVASLSRLVRYIAAYWSIGAVAAALLTLTNWVVLDMALAAVIGFFVSRGVIGTQTYLQLSTPDAMRGRTLGVHGIVSRASPALGALCIGWALDYMGLTIPVFIATAIVLAVALAAIPSILALQDPDPDDD